MKLYNHSIQFYEHALNTADMTLKDNYQAFKSSLTNSKREWAHTTTVHNLFCEDWLQRVANAKRLGSKTINMFQIMLKIVSNMLFGCSLAVPCSSTLLVETAVL